MTNNKQRQAALERVDSIKQQISEKIRGFLKVGTKDAVKKSSLFYKFSWDEIQTIQAALELAREQLAEPNGLRPCPFCGGEANLATVMGLVECRDCFASAEDEHWNTRTSPALEKLVEDTCQT